METPAKDFYSVCARNFLQRIGFTVCVPETSCKGFKVCVCVWQELPAKDWFYSVCGGNFLQKIYDFTVCVLKTYSKGLMMCVCRKLPAKD